MSSLRGLQSEEVLGLSSSALAIIMSFVASCATALGASCIYFLPNGKIDADIMTFNLALAAGTMLTVSFMELLPRVFEQDRFCAALCALWGAFCYVLLSVGINRFCPAECLSQCTHQQLLAADIVAKSEPRKVRRWRLALVLMASLTAHNFPEGIAVAVSTMSSARLGGVVMLAILVHNIPEGMAIAVTSFAANESRRKAMMMAVASGLSEPIGAIIAVTCLQGLSEAYLHCALAFVAGMMCAVSLIELIPEAWQQRKTSDAFWGGLLSGCLAMMTTEYIIESYK